MSNRFIASTDRAITSRVKIMQHAQKSGHGTSDPAMALIAERVTARFAVCGYRQASCCRLAGACL